MKGEKQNELWVISSLCLRRFYSYILKKRPQQARGRFLWRPGTPIKAHRVSCAAAGQMDFSALHQFTDDEIGHNCFSSSRGGKKKDSVSIIISDTVFSLSASPPFSGARRRLFPNERRPRATRHPSDVPLNCRPAWERCRHYYPGCFSAAGIVGCLFKAGRMVESGRGLESSRQHNQTAD